MPTFNYPTVYVNWFFSMLWWYKCTLPLTSPSFSSCPIPSPPQSLPVDNTSVHWSYGFWWHTGEWDPGGSEGPTTGCKEQGKEGQTTPSPREGEQAHLISPIWRHPFIWSVCMGECNTVELLCEQHKNICTLKHTCLMLHYSIHIISPTMHAIEWKRVIFVE